MQWSKEELIAQLQKKRLVFTVTTGRSGTGYLSKYLSDFDDVYCSHEESPSFVEAMRDGKSNPALYAQFWLEKKIPSILQKPGRVFVETSHLSSKGFFEFLFENHIKFDIITIHRNAIDVARSYYHLKTIPAKTKGGLQFLQSPNDADSFLKMDNWSELTDFQLCYWYCLETAERIKYYSKKVQENGGQVVHLEFADLATKLRYKELESFLGVKPSRREVILSYLKAQLNRNRKSRNKIKSRLTSTVDFKGEVNDLHHKLNIRING